ncbi:MAG: gliding motility protein GldL [Prevotella sp.]|nr:gliding motility protein GldL [Prevotella sp.]
MSKYSKINFIYFLQKWMDSVPGQTFLNYAYSWGAAVVILGTLFKLTHLPGANLMLFLGMGTEVVVFFISAFDRPFDKSTIDMALDNHMADNVIDDVAGNPLGIPAVQPAAQPVQQNPAVQQHPYSQPQGKQHTAPVAIPTASPEPADGNGAPVVIGGSNVGGGNIGGGTVSGGTTGGTIVIGGGGNGADGTPVTGNVQAAVSGVPSNGTIIIGGGNTGGVVASGSPVVSGKQSSETSNTSDADTEKVEMTVNTETAAPQIITPAPAVSRETAAEMEVVTKAYIERLAELNEMLEKVGQLTSRLSTDSEEMENLNRTLTGIARVYEMQLKSASQQITTQDSINEQTRIMAQKIQELNNIYTRMIEAMTVNMPGTNRGLGN